MTQGNNRVLSKAETFGRLYSCGFEIVSEQQIGNELYFLARKVREPYFDYSPTYGPLIRLKRYGKGGKLFGVYKARTMHPYSEYLQDYIYQNNKLDEGGKFKDDFRVTTIGKLMRKVWLDELPMFINVFKGEMKLVGVRPLSRQYFGLYSDEVKEKRLKFKPGLIPPYYVDMPKTLEEIMASEMRYLEAYEKHPLLTDWRYFWKALYNIIIKRARSK
jgi:lipopolysaccharide/colanic/teichoic acid biosynthesis glycosyltransferase